MDLAPDGPGDDGLTLEAWVRADTADGRIISKATGTTLNEQCNATASRRDPGASSPFGKVIVASVSPTIQIGI